MAGPLDGKEALLGAQAPAAMAGRALQRLGTALGSAAVAGLAIVGLYFATDGGIWPWEEIARLTGEAIEKKARVLPVPKATTYVAAAFSTLLTLLYFLMRSGLLGGRRND